MQSAGNCPIIQKKEISLELKSLILDELEVKYGQEPNDDEVKSFIAEYGSPGKVAARYRNDRFVIGSGFTDLYFFIIKMMLLGLSIAFTVIYVMELIAGPISAASLGLGFLTAIGRIAGAMLSAIGTLTIIFIVITRIYKEEIVDLEDDWTPDELKEIELSPKVESSAESIVSIIFLTFFLIIINFAPHLIPLAETSFERSGIMLGHHINMEVFSTYLLMVTLLCIGEIVYHILALFSGRKTRSLALMDLALEILNLVLFIIIVMDMSIYSDYTSLIGFRGIFMIIAVISVFETLSKTYGYIRYFVMKQTL